jgi:hypothetical protein
MPYPKGVNIERSEDCARKRRKTENHHNIDVVRSMENLSGQLRKRVATFPDNNNWLLLHNRIAHGYF